MFLACDILYTPDVQITRTYISSCHTCTVSARHTSVICRSIKRCPFTERRPRASNKIREGGRWGDGMCEMGWVPEELQFSALNSGTCQAKCALPKGDSAHKMAVGTVLPYL